MDIREVDSMSFQFPDGEFDLFAVILNSLTHSSLSLICIGAACSQSIMKVLIPRR